MNETIACPNCHRHLNLPGAVLGREVQCPSCGQTFLASLELKPGRPAVQNPPPAPPRRQAPRTFDPAPDPDEDYHTAPVRPHRGALILSLGILSLFLCCLPPGGVILACVNLWMASADLEAMRRRRMDPAGKGRTKAGQLCSGAAIVASLLYFLFACLWQANRR